MMCVLWNCTIWIHSVGLQQNPFLPSFFPHTCYFHLWTRLVTASTSILLCMGSYIIMCLLTPPLACPKSQFMCQTQEYIVGVQRSPLHGDFMYCSPYVSHCGVKWCTDPLLLGAVHPKWFIKFDNIAVHGDQAIFYSYFRLPSDGLCSLINSLPVSALSLIKCVLCK